MIIKGRVRRYRVAMAKRRKKRRRLLAGATRPPSQKKPAAVEISLPPEADRGRSLGWWLAPLTVGLAALAIYVATLAPTVATGDSGELISAAYTGGVAHPPGYPVFTMLGWIATHLWPGSPAVMMNFLSALFQAATVGLIAVLTARLVDPGWPRADDRAGPAVAGLAAGATLAVSTAFWAYAVVAEVFPLNDLFAAALLLLAIEWYRDRTKVWALWTLGLVSGLGAAHQQTIVLLGPALAVLLIAGASEDAKLGRARRRRERKRRVVKASHFWIGAAFIGLGLLAYLYLPFAATTDPAVNFGDPETLDRFTNVVTRGSYGSFSLIPGAERDSVVENLGVYGWYLIRAFNPVGILFAVTGSVWLARRYRREAAALLTAFVVTGPFFVMFAGAPLESPLTRGILERFYILSSLPLAVAVGAGVYAVIEWLRAREVFSKGRLAMVAGVVVVALVGTLAATRWDSMDQTSNRVAELYGRDILTDLEPGAILLTREDHNYTSLVYTQRVGGIRPDVIVLDTELLKLDSYVAEAVVRHPEIEIPFDLYVVDSGSLTDLVEANLSERPVYVVGAPLEELQDRFVEIRAGLVRRVAPLGTADEYEMLLADPDLVIGLHFPTSDYPEKSWERLITVHYANAAHSLGFAFHEPEPTANDGLVVEMYRRSIDLAGPSEAYKNLGLFLWERDGDPEEIIDLWETYLDFDPDDPNTDDIRRAIDQLRGR